MDPKKHRNRWDVLRIIAAVLAALAVLFAVSFALFFILTGLSTRSPGDATSHYGGFPGVMAAVFALSFLIGPTLTLIAVIRDAFTLAPLGLLLYVFESVWLGFSLGGPHLVIGVPLVLGSFIAFSVSRWRRTRARTSGALG
ncbi:MAG: hypothetical protein ACYDCK_02595 [Thermoplasmatota archaeon]